MNSYTVVLKDADEIEQFFLSKTGMKPGYAQLSRGPGGLQCWIDELNGVVLVWTRQRARVRWRDEMRGVGLYMGFALECAGPIIARGRNFDADVAQVWIPGAEMDLILPGPNLTLEIGVAPRLVEELGWQFGGDPLRNVPQKKLDRLTRTCRFASAKVRGAQAKARESSAGWEIIQWRDRILEELETVLQHWLCDSDIVDLPNFTETPHYRLIRRGDEFFDGLAEGAHFRIDDLVQSLCVPRRTVFYAYRKLLGLGPRQYYELRRLHTFRSRLRRASSRDTTVTRIATELDFGDLGRLAGRYKRQFGESPRETLKRPNPNQ